MSGCSTACRFTSSKRAQNALSPACATCAVFTIAGPAHPGSAEALRETHPKAHRRPNPLIRGRLPGQAPKPRAQPHPTPTAHRHRRSRAPTKTPACSAAQHARKRRDLDARPSVKGAMTLRPSPDGSATSVAADIATRHPTRRWPARTRFEPLVGDIGARIHHARQTTPRAPGGSASMRNDPARARVAQLVEQLGLRGFSPPAFAGAPSSRGLLIFLGGKRHLLVVMLEAVAYRCGRLPPPCQGVCRREAAFRARLLMRPLPYREERPETWTPPPSGNRPTRARSGNCPSR